MIQFPTMLRKMWSGSEVQEWLDENVWPELSDLRAQRVAWEETRTANANLRNENGELRARIAKLEQA